MPEYMDFVNENDEVIGRDTRENIHNNHKIHRGIHVIICNAAGEILIQKRSLSKDYYPGYYDISVGAQVASGESYEECAERELMEELGCSAPGLVPVAYYDAFSPRQREKRKLFFFTHDGPFRIDPDEVEQIEFISMDDVVQVLKERQFTEGCRKSLHLFTCYLAVPNPVMLDREAANFSLMEAGLAEQG